SSSAYAILTAEADLNNQPGVWGLGLNGKLDSSVAFTGQKSVRIQTVAGQSSTKWGPVVDLKPCDSILCIAELWGKCSVPNKFQLKMQTQLNGNYTSISKYLSQSNQWQHISCSLMVVPPETLHVYTGFESTGQDVETTYVDDFRVYPANSMVSSETIDGFGRVTSESDYNNLPVRSYYNHYNNISLTADFLGRPISGSEWFYKGTDRASGLNPYEYNREMPNSLITFRPTKYGVVDDFSLNPFLKYNISGNGHIFWDNSGERIKLDVLASGDSTYGDIIIPVDSFADGFFAVDFATTGGSTGGIPPALSEAALWIGFENSHDSGYVLGFETCNGAVIAKYSGQNYGGQQTIGQSISRLNQELYTPGRVARLMIGKIGNKLYAFYNNDCLYICADSSIQSFTKLRLRIRNICPQLGLKYAWIDNLTFYSEPQIKVDFINAYGMVKQTQQFDGTNLICSASRNTYDSKVQVQFMPVQLTPNIHYISDYTGNLQTYPDHRTLFDYIYNYVDDSDMYCNFNNRSWKPGYDLTHTDYIYTYYHDSVGVPNCLNSSGLLVPYAENVFYSEPSRRIKEIRYPGKFRTHTSKFDYKASEVTIPGFDVNYYGIGKVSKDGYIDENGGRKIVFNNKAGGVIAVVNDSIQGGLNTLTRYYPDFNGNDTLIIQPAGHKIRRQYNNLGWLIFDSSGDYGVIEHIYDNAGNLRFAKTATDKALNRFHYKKYDKLGRVTEEGICVNPIYFRRELANAPEMPQSPIIITSKYEYDDGLYGRGRLTKAINYPSCFVDSASWDSFEYDEYGRVNKQKKFIKLIDSSAARTMRAEYNLQGQPTKIIYPNNSSVGYKYDNAGRLKEVTDNNNYLCVAYNYWPDGSIRKKIMGFNNSPQIPAQVVDYKYNARGWLESINDGNVISSISGSGDHFSLLLKYDTGAYCGQEDPLEGCEGTYPTGYWNGNISSYQLKTSPGTYSENLKQRFAYDGLDRLAATSYEGYLPPPLTKYYYDLNGNIDQIVKDSGLTPVVYDYQYYSGTNRLEQVTNLAPGAANFAYTPSGSMTAYNNLQMTVSYNSNEEMSRRARLFPLGTYYVDYWYDTNGKRIAKKYQYYYLRPCGGGQDPDEPKLLSLKGQSFGGGAISSSVSDEPLSGELAFPRPEPAMGMSGSPGGSYCPTPGMSIEGYYYFGDQMLSVYTGSSEGSLTDNYVYANGERVARFKGTLSDVRYYLTDHLGSVLGLVRHDGTIVNEVQYHPYGEILRRKNSDPVMRHGYTSKEMDFELNSQWDYFGARYYAPELKIFTQVDPMADKYPFLSPYLYCAGNPMKYVDPNGQYTVESIDADVSSKDKSGKWQTKRVTVYFPGWRTYATNFMCAAVPGYWLSKTCETEPQDKIADIPGYIANFSRYAGWVGVFLTFYKSFAGKIDPPDLAYSYYVRYRNAPPCFDEACVIERVEKLKTQLAAREAREKSSKVLLQQGKPDRTRPPKTEEP
ncbi:MAG: hypothetical protein NTV06_05865, partial [candidate division Zixibacteria bacterium]|nr:hypothetical protein [candidate division Zixibacteria bacterium]